MVEQCSQDQERDYLTTYLATRKLDTSRLTVLLKQRACKQGMSWAKPVLMRIFAQRPSDALSPYRPARKPRGRKKIA